MRVLLLSDTGDGSEELAAGIAAAHGLRLIDWPSDAPDPLACLRECLATDRGPAAFIIRGGPETPGETAALDSMLEALKAPLDLVLEIETESLPLEQRLMAPVVREGTVPDYYRARGLLRRMRSEADCDDLLAAGRRIIDDTMRSGTSAYEPVQHGLGHSGEPEVPAIPTESVAGEVSKQPVPGTDETPDSEDAERGGVSGPSWKRAALKHGRIKRGSVGSRSSAEANPKPRKRPRS
jgi:hypothetical protein